MLPTPGFHHLHLRSIDPATAISFYTRQFPTAAIGSWGEFPALLSPNDVMVLFDKVDEPPTNTPQSAIWHFGWHVTDSRATVVAFDARDEVATQPLYTGVVLRGTDLISKNSKRMSGRISIMPLIWRRPVERCHSYQMISRTPSHSSARLR